MTKPSPIPSELSSGPFTTRAGLANGLTPRRLRAQDLEGTVWGVRSAERAETIQDRCRLLQARMPRRAFFSHATAALLLGIPIPVRLERRPSLDVSVPSPTRALSARGLIGHRLSIDPTDVLERDGLRLTSPARTWIDLASLLALGDLVAAGDFLIHRRNPHCSTDLLRTAVHELGPARGVAVARRALELLHDRSESAQESRLRVILVVAGFPPPLINHSVSDRFGEFVARTDFRFETFRLVLEYQGDYHRTTKGQWRADMTRRSRLEAEGWRVMELNADDLNDPEELVRRIRAVIALR